MKNSTSVKSWSQWFKNRYGNISFHPMDYTILSYILLLGFLIIPFHNDVPRWGIYPIAHLLVAMLILEFLKWTSDKESRFIRFLRIFYPGFGLALAWGELNSLVTMILPYWANDFVVNLDKLIFGVHPTAWVQTIFQPWLTELMNFFYAFYYLFIPIVGLSLYLRGKKSETMDFLFLVFFTYCSVFLLFLLFPAEGPWIILKELHTVRPKGGFFLKLNQFIQGQGSIRGGCFPSSHVAAAYTILWGTFRYNFKLGIFLFPCVFGMAAATVYCQYHHAVDALSGLALGTLLYFVGILILKKWHKVREGAD